jgi:hypothetical protein
VELLGILLAAIGAGDVLRVTLSKGLPVAVRLGIVVAVDLGLLLIGLLVGVAPWWLVALATVPLALWRTSIRTTQTQPGLASRRELSPTRPGMLLIALFFIAIVGFASEAYSQGWFTTDDAVSSTEAEASILAAGLGIFLTVSSNALVRAALDRDAPRQDTTPDNGPTILTAPQLKGGRWIGPLERLALAGLLAAGAYPVAAGVIAAKGIVRFPEIQADSESGNKAEYFLVGSLVSWTLALIAFGLIWYSAGLPAHVTPARE